MRIWPLGKSYGKKAKQKPAARKDKLFGEFLARHIQYEHSQRDNSSAYQKWSILFQERFLYISRAKTGKIAKILIRAGVVALGMLILYVSRKKLSKQFIF